MQEIEAPAVNPREPLSLWNPYAAAVWAFFLMPGFGAWIHAKNWDSLGRPDEAKKSMAWFYSGIGLIIITTLMSLFLNIPEGLNRFFDRAFPFAFFGAWYWGHGKSQVSLVKDGNIAYVKRPWFQIVTAWIGAAIVYLLITFGIALALDKSSHSLEENLQSGAVPVVTEIVKGQLGGSSSCKKVVIINQMPGGAYEAAASMDDGKVLKILIKVQGDQFFVEIPPQ